MRLSVLCPLMVAGGLLTACGTSDSPGRPTMVVEPIQVDSVAVTVAESFPVQVFAHVRGIVGDGCATLLPIEQRRAGNTVTVEIDRQRPTQGICTQIAQLFDQNIRLDGAFAPGLYRLTVNGLSQAFRVD